MHELTFRHQAAQWWHAIERRGVTKTEAKDEGNDVEYAKARRVHGVGSSPKLLRVRIRA